MTEKEIPKILIVDDSPANLNATEALLAGLGIKIYKANSGREALKSVLQEDFALIILDVKMPEMDGIETAAMIRQKAKTKNTPIMFMTAFYYTDKDVLSAYKTGGIIDFISVPVVPEILRSKALVFIELQRKINELRLINEAQEAEITLRKQVEEALQRTKAELDTYKRLIKEKGYKLEE